MAWAWKANGAGASNTDGTITATVSADTTAGFSIISYTGNVTAGATIGHGLTAAPEFIITMIRGTAAYEHACYHVGAGATKALWLDGTAAAATDVTYWNNAAPSSSLITLGSGGRTNKVDTIIAYAWHSVPGYSKFGSYTGNASTDGPFVHCGFRPRWVLFKGSTAVDNWVIWDTERDTYNNCTNLLLPNSTAAESSYAGESIDILSNGFKVRYAGYPNTSGVTYIYAAFAEYPFGGDGVSQARAR